MRVSAKKKKKPTRVCAASWQHSKHCLLPATYWEREREAACLNNEAASLPVFILSWINTPKRNAVLFFVRKKHMLFSLGQTDNGMFCCLLDFCWLLLSFATSFPSCWKTMPTIVSIWLFPTYPLHVGVCSFGSCRKWSTVGIHIITGFSTNSQSYLHIESTQKKLWENRVTLF